MEPETPTPIGPETPGTPPAVRVHVDARLAPEADPALEHLREAGYRVILVGDAPHAPGDAPGDAAHAAGGAPHVPATGTDPGDPAEVVVAALPVGADGWLVTGDAAVCTGVRELRRLRTILVGPTVQGRGLAHRPADVEARDLLDAVLTILAAGAMPGDARAR